MVKTFGNRGAAPAAVTALSLTLGLFYSPYAGAGECTGFTGTAPALAEHTAQERLQFIRKSMRDTAKMERRYALGWGLSYVGFAAGTWFLYPFADDKRGQLISSSFNSVSSTLGGINVLIDPLRVIHDQHKLEALLAQPVPDDQRCAVVAKAEKLFIHVADNEAGARSARAHILGFLGTVGLGLILGYGFKRAESAAINTSIGVALSELMIFTRPTTAIRSLERYRMGELEVSAPPPSVLSWSIVPNLTSTTYGAAWAGTF